jgi:hypothetical protein
VQVSAERPDDRERHIGEDSPFRVGELFVILKVHLFLVQEDVDDV